MIKLHEFHGCYTLNVYIGKLSLWLYVSPYIRFTCVHDNKLILSCVLDLREKAHDGAW